MSSTRSCSSAAHSVGPDKPELGQDLSHRQRMGDVRVAAAPQLVPVVVRRDAVGPLDVAQLGLGVRRADRAEQRLEDGVTASHRRAARAGRAGRALGPRPAASALRTAAAGAAGRATAQRHRSAPWCRTAGASSATLRSSPGSAAIRRVYRPDQRLSRAQASRQTVSRECTGTSPSRARPSRKPSSMSTWMPDDLTAGPATSSTAAAAVPPVARTSSTIRTRSPGLDRVVPDLQDGLAVLEDVGLDQRRAGQLALLAHGHESRPQAVGDRRGEDEAARLDPDDPVDRSGASRPARRRPP